MTSKNNRAKADGAKVNERGDNNRGHAKHDEDKGEDKGEDEDEDEDYEGLELGPFKENRPLDEVFPELVATLNLPHTNVEVFLVFTNKTTNKTSKSYTYSLYKEMCAALLECGSNGFAAARRVATYFHTPTQTGWFAWKSGPTKVTEADKRALKRELVKYMRAANKVLANMSRSDYLDTVDTTDLDKLYCNTRVAIDTEGVSFSDVRPWDFIDDAGINKEDQKRIVVYVTPYNHFIVSSAIPALRNRVAAQVRRYINDYYNSDY
jgi:hypothetical protein